MENTIHYDDYKKHYDEIYTVKCCGTCMYFVPDDEDDDSGECSNRTYGLRGKALLPVRKEASVSVTLPDDVVVPGVVMYYVKEEVDVPPNVASVARTQCCSHWELRDSEFNQDEFQKPGDASEDVV